MNIEQMAKERRRVRIHAIQSYRAGLPATLTLDDWLVTIHMFNGLCAYCRKTPFEVLEHVIPADKGGGTTADNCVPACRTCNSRKWTHVLDIEPTQETLPEVTAQIWAFVNTHPSRPKKRFHPLDSVLQSIALPQDLFEEIKEVARQEERPVSWQILWMLKQALRLEQGA